MTHPIMFDDRDPVLARLRRLALALPGAAEKVSHGRPVFFTTKVFAHYGGSIKVDGQHQRHEQSVLLRCEPDEFAALEQQDRSYRPAYLAGAGWIGIDLDADTDWGEIAELLIDSYRLTAPRRRVAELADSREHEPSLEDEAEGVGQ